MTIEESIKIFIDKNTLPVDSLYITGSTLLVYYDEMIESDVTDLDIIIEFTGFVPFDRDAGDKTIDIIRSHTVHIPNDFPNRAKKLFTYKKITVHYVSVEDWACTLAIHGSHGNPKYFNRLKYLIDNNKLDYKKFHRLVRKMSKDPAIPLRAHIFEKGRNEFWKEYPIPEDIDD